MSYNLLVATPIPNRWEVWYKLRVKTPNALLHIINQTDVDLGVAVGIIGNVPDEKNSDGTTTVTDCRELMLQDNQPGYRLSDEATTMKVTLFPRTEYHLT